MEYSVEVTARAEADLKDIYGFIEAGSSDAAKRWFVGLEQRILSLHSMPLRGRRTPEDSTLHQVLYGNKPHIYRIIYKLNSASNLVTVVHIRHGAQSAPSGADRL